MRRINIVLLAATATLGVFAACAQPVPIGKADVIGRAAQEKDEVREVAASGRDGPADDAAVAEMVEEWLAPTDDDDSVDDLVRRWFDEPKHQGGDNGV